MLKWITIDEYAKDKGVCKRTVMNWKKDGKIKTKLEEIEVKQTQKVLFVEVRE